jgi:hypothetical protein
MGIASAAHDLKGYSKNICRTQKRHRVVINTINNRETSNMKRLTWLIAILFGATLLSTLASAQGLSNFGRTTIGGVVSGGLRADFKRGSKFVLSEKAVMIRICAFIDGRGGGSGSQTLRFALYRDQNGLPAQQVLESEYSGFEAARNAEWACRETARALIEPGTYWLMIHTAGDPGVIRYYYDYAEGRTNWYGNADTFADGASDAFGVGSVGEGTISIRAEYLPESQVHIGGTRTVGTRVSSPMSAQMKRGSSFVLTEQAGVMALSAYIDGLGGTAGSQPISIGLYEDVNGEPSTLVATGPVPSWSVVAGRTGRWVSVLGINGRRWLNPGRYWIVLHTGGPAGVLRYYMEGTGNWRGNADSGATPSPIFGAANTGDGTITAHILYFPTSLAFGTIGRTTPGTIPSGALTANYIRGSGFQPSQPFNNAQATALWAYLDGNGGATGSQKVRLGLYQGELTSPQLNRMAVSDEVTIPAGKPAGWVRFSLPYNFFSYTPAEQSKTFHVMLLSGSPQGVARYYLSDDADNWRGAPLPYSGGAPASMYLDAGPSPGAIALTPGTRTMSAYVEYLKADEVDEQ